MGRREINAAAFKERCLALLDRVAEGREEYVITKRGTPVARLVPLEDARQGEPLEGSVTFLAEVDDLFSTGEAWDVERS